MSPCLRISPRPIAVAIMVATMGSAPVPGMSQAEPQAPPCREWVGSLAKAMSDKPGMQELKNKLAQAALLCRDGKTTEADSLLAQVEEALKRLPKNDGASG